MYLIIPSLVSLSSMLQLIHPFQVVWTHPQYKTLFLYLGRLDNHIFLFQKINIGWGWSGSATYGHQTIKLDQIVMGRIYPHWLSMNWLYCKVPHSWCNNIPKVMMKRNKYCHSSRQENISTKAIHISVIFNVCWSWIHVKLMMLINFSVRWM